MRIAQFLLLGIVVLVLGGCTVTPEEQDRINAGAASVKKFVQGAVPVLCAVDGVAQPIAAVALPIAVAGSAGLVNTENALVHPAVVKACADAAAAAGAKAASPVSVTIPAAIVAAPPTASAGS